MAKRMGRVRASLIDGVTNEGSTKPATFSRVCFAGGANCCILKMCVKLLSNERYAMLDYCMARP